MTGFFAWKTITLGNIVDTVKVFEAAEESISDAYDVITEHGFYSKALIIALIVSGGLLALTVISGLIAAGLKKSALNPKPKKEKAPKPKKAKKVKELPKPEIKSIGTSGETLVAAKFCPHCGTKCDSATKFCSSCGNQIN